MVPHLRMLYTLFIQNFRAQRHAISRAAESPLSHHMSTTGHDKSKAEKNSLGTVSHSAGGILWILKTKQGVVGKRCQFATLNWAGF